MPGPWPLIRSRLRGSYRVFTVRADTARSPRTGMEHDFYVIESSDWTNVIPITEDGLVVMVRQFRHGIKEVTLEVPGGMVEPGDSPVDAARRELLEETGYAGPEMIQLGAVHPQPAIFNNRCYTYLAPGVRKVTELKQDRGEDIEVALVPLADIPAMIRTGGIGHALVIAAFALFWQYQGCGGRDIPVPGRRE